MLIPWKYGGQTGIRTLDTLRYTRFPSVRLQPLGHLSARARGNPLTLPHGEQGGVLRHPSRRDELWSSIQTSRRKPTGLVDRPTTECRPTRAPYQPDPDTQSVLAKATQNDGAGDVDLEPETGL